MRAPQTQPAPGEAPWREGFLALPFIGLNSFQGSAANNTDIGLRLGALLGSRISENWSINGELAIDAVNPTATSGVDVSEYMVDLAFSPLLHVPTPSGEFIVGPILGPWYLTASASDGVSSADISGYGWMVGANLGMLFTVNEQAKIGVLLSFAVRNPIKLCASATGVAEECVTSGFTSAKVLGITLAAMF